MKIKILAPALLALLLSMTSCMFFKEKVNVKDAEIEGMLNGAFEVETGSYSVTKDKDGNKIVTVKIKRTDESVPFSTETIDVLSENDDDDAITLAGFGYIGYDKKGKEIDEIEAEDNDNFIKDQLAILKLDNGETGELSFVLNSKSIPARIVLTSDVKFVKSGKITMDGTIGNLEIVNFSMNVDFADKMLSGKYQYAKTAHYGAFLEFRGDITREEFEVGDIKYIVDLREANEKGQWSGSFDGSIELTRDDKTSPYYYVLQGLFTNYRGNSYTYDFVSKPISD